MATDPRHEYTKNTTQDEEGASVATVGIITLVIVLAIVVGSFYFFKDSAQPHVSFPAASPAASTSKG